MTSREATKSVPYLIAATFILVVAAGFRFYALDGFSLSLDEATMWEAARGVMAKGYPFLTVGSMQVDLATYELVPYPLALVGWLFGVTDWTLRIPSALFGTITALLIFHAGYKWFDLRVGILAGLLYALSPWSIFWAHNSFHPSQHQLFVLLTTIQVHRLLHDEKVPTRTYYLTALFFSCAYLSWEGTGFVLPILAILAIIMRWGDWDWLKSRHIWIASGIVVAVVSAQLIRRVLLFDDYLMVGSGKSDMTLPQLVFTKTSYNPYYYLVNFFGTEFNFVLAGIFILGIAYCKRDWSQRFVYTFTALGIFFMTNFLGYYAAHYVYYLLPIFLLAASAAAMHIIDWLTARSRQSPLVSIRIANGASAAALVALIGIYAGPYGLKLHDFSDWFRNPVRTDIRPNLAGIDYRGLAAALAERVHPGDVVIAQAPLSLERYAAMKGDYFLQTITDRKVIFDPNREVPVYTDKYVGNPVMRTEDEFMDVLERHDRVWLYAAPFGGFTSIIDHDLLDFMETRMKVVAETFDGKLYLWEK